MENSYHFFIFLALAAIFIPSALAVDHIVGDDNGWTKDFNYTNWAQGKTFYLNDNLIFNYEKGSHNVYKVNGTDFKNCTIPVNATPLTTGNDVIPLKTAGRKWYICGFDGHCSSGQKFVITVLDQMAPAQSPLPGGTTPPPPSGASKAAVSGHFGFMVMVFAILGMIVV